VDGGTAGNAVPGQATALVRKAASELPQAERIEVKDAGEGIAHIIATGRGAHASTPEGSINAILVLVDYLRAQGIGSAAERAFLDLEHDVLSTTDGSSLGIARVMRCLGR
jgi:succinyl-diaminopimelate desuccinylase